MEETLAAALASRRAEVLTACACTNLRKAMRVATQRYDAALRPCGLRATQLTLLLACADPEGTTIADVAAALAVDRTTLSRTLRPLARKGLIDVERGPDRRARHITITARGRETLVAALPLWAEAERRFAETLGWDGMEQLLTALARVVAIREAQDTG
ncbi:MAG: MarR family winged helix-turn-helix transcriptional regulator [Alphaproteobacteria bacterium]